MRISLIDNHESFTSDLFQMLAVVAVAELEVRSNDDFSRYRAMHQENVYGIVISPGPGGPERARRFDSSRQALDRTDIPALGVCFGFPGRGHAAGTGVVRAPKPRHGRLNTVQHDDEASTGPPDPFEAARYHTLITEGPPSSLIPTDWTEHGIPMAVRHRRRPADDAAARGAAANRTRQGRACGSA